MKGRKKVSDYFSDHKFSRIEKERIWLLCSQGTIIWIVGERTDDNHRIDEGTKKAFAIKYLPKKDDKRNK
jgi:tRNA(Ile)-lysidine synthase